MSIVHLATKRSERAGNRRRLGARINGSVSTPLADEAALYFWTVAKDVRAGRRESDAERLAEGLADAALLRDMERHAGLRQRCDELLGE